ncbi:hypothetical protein BT69DRAFT_1287751 [Atractiella rhizophila]|nr:hypothetical protein BT69DRAFT_1287751 [Atractiella rhizophila]
MEELLREAQTLRDQIWTKSTFYYLTAKWVNFLCQKWRPSQIPRWKVVILSMSSNSPTSAWFSCKFAIPPFSSFQNVTIEVESVESILEVDDRDRIGLVIFDCTSSEHESNNPSFWEEARHKLHEAAEALAIETTYCPSLLVASCVPQRGESVTLMERQIVENLGMQRPQDIWATHIVRLLPVQDSEPIFATDITILLPEIQFRSNQKVVSAADFIVPFLNLWKTALSTSSDVVRNSQHSAIAALVLHLFMSSLLHLADLVSRSVVRDLGKSFRASGAALPALSISPGSSIGAQILSYLEQPAFNVENENGSYGNEKQKRDFERNQADLQSLKSAITDMESEFQVILAFLDFLPSYLHPKLVLIRVLQPLSERSQLLRAFQQRLEQDVKAIQVKFSDLEKESELKKTKKRKELESKEKVQSPNKKIKLEDLMREMREAREKYLLVT